jgi:hypothetical protein
VGGVIVIFKILTEYVQYFIIERGGGVYIELMLVIVKLLFCYTVIYMSF